MAEAKKLVIDISWQIHVKSELQTQWVFDTIVNTMINAGQKRLATQYQKALSKRIERLNAERLEKKWSLITKPRFQDLTMVLKQFPNVTLINDFTTVVAPEDMINV